MAKEVSGRSLQTLSTASFLLCVSGDVGNKNRRQNPQGRCHLSLQPLPSLPSAHVPPGTVTFLSRFSKSRQGDNGSLIVSLRPLRPRERHELLRWRNIYSATVAQVSAAAKNNRTPGTRRPARHIVYISTGHHKWIGETSDLARLYL